MTLSCTIDATGISAPDYPTILATITASYQSIFGSDVILTPDSQDGQWIGILASMINDSNQSMIATYNQFSPTTSQGAGLSSVVKINGLEREASSNSTSDITLVGVAGTVINNGIVGDNLNLGTRWALPAVVTIPDSGTIIETATSVDTGSITAAANSLTVLLTPTLGWQTANNVAQATPGAPVEQDATLRQRQAVSTALPAQSPLDSIAAAVANTTGVTKSKAYENDTGSTDSNGIPGHTISLIVEGGDSVEIATAISLKKTPGTGTYGTTSETILDPRGIPNLINFYRLATVELTVDVIVKKLALYLSTTDDLIIAAASDYINGLDIGQNVLNGNVAAVAQLPATPQASTFTVLGVTMSRPSNPVDTTITGGTYAAGTTVMTVASVADIFKTSIIQITLDDATTYNATVTGISLLALTLTPGVPTSRSVLTGASVKLISDVKIQFNEGAFVDNGDVTVTT